MPGEKIPTSGGENQENEKSRDQMVEELDNIDVDVLVAAAKDLGLDDSLAYTYEDNMDDAQLDSFFKKVKSIQSGAGEENKAGGAEPENNPEPEDDNESGDNDRLHESQSQNEVENGDEKKELSNEEKKKFGAGLSAKAKRLAVLAIIGSVGVGTVLGMAAANIFGGDRNKQKALGKLEGQAGITYDYDKEDSGATETDADGGESEVEHVFGERYEDIEAVTTTHGHFANEEGTGANEKKNKDVCFDVAYEMTGDEEQEKDQICERLVQLETLASYYSYFGYKAEQAGLDNYGVEGVSYKNANDVIEQLRNDPEKHQAVYDYMYDMFQDDKTHISEEKRTGDFSNFYMLANYDKGDLDKSQSIEVVGCDTHEQDTDVFNVDISLEDSNGNKLEVDGDLKVICIQPVDEKDGFTTGYKKVKEEDPNGMGLDVDTPKKENPPEDNSKDPEMIKKRAGDDQVQLDAGDKTERPDPANYNPDTGNDGSTGGEDPNTVGEDGRNNDTIQNADDSNFEKPTQRTEEGAQEKAQEDAGKAEEAKTKESADQMENTDRDQKYDTNGDGTVDMSELGF
ncbi:hypothetical protein IKG50_00720 [Candidatus Saccharibacteria bacterium]|nr:hypothetical protein [Candidatus Saccharibacteria bacterium]